MTDITERLHSVVGQHFPACVEAADEITRLRGQVADLTTECVGLRVNKQNLRDAQAKSEPAVATPKNEAIQRAISVRESGFTTSDTYLAIWRECERAHGIAAPSPEGDAS